MDFLQQNSVSSPIINTSDVTIIGCVVNGTLQVDTTYINDS